MSKADVPEELLKPLAGPLRDLVAWLDERQDPYAIIGGVAASFLGRARATGDVDAVVITDEENLAVFLADAEAHGFSSRIADPIEFARRNRIMLLVHDGDAVNVDLSLGVLPFERELIARAVRVDFFGVGVPLAPPEELIAMKVLAFRGRDIADIESILDAHPELDMARVKRWVRLLSEALESPEIAERLESLLRRRH